MKSADNFNYELGIVQGRLTPTEKGKLQNFPNENWREEFLMASNLNLNFIELLSETIHNPNNPIWSSSGREKIKYLCEKNNLQIYSACTDYIIENSLLSDEKTVNYVLDFIKSMNKLNCKKIIFPLMGKSDLNSSNFEDYISILRDLQIEATKFHIEILIESLVEHNNINKLIERIGSPIKCVFDTGNIINKVDSIYDEIANLDFNIGHIHIKDKLKDNTSCLLGTGVVNFSEVFRALKKINYKKSIVFETPRGVDPVKTCKYNINFIKFISSQYYE